jgi:hypothetical protein
MSGTARRVPLVSESIKMKNQSGGITVIARRHKELLNKVDLDAFVTEGNIIHPGKGLSLYSIIDNTWQRINLPPSWADQ